MTDLQISLIAIGGALILAVYSFDKWQEYKARKSVERAFAGEPDDVLMKPQRQEPILQDENLSDKEKKARTQPTAPTESSEPTEQTEQAAAAPSITGDSMHTFVQTSDTKTTLSSSPSLPLAGLTSQDATSANSQMSAAKPSSPKPDSGPIDTLIDCVMPLSFDTPLRGDKLLPILQKLRHVGNKSVHYAGLAQGWESIVHSGVYSALRVGVQMAGRSSAINELEYSELVMRLRQLADELGGEVDVLDMKDVIIRARSLHKFVVDHDAQLGVNIHSNGAPWAINTLLLALEKQGFDLRPDGRFVMPDGEGGYLFSLSTNVTPAADITSRLTLLLDVPCVSPEKNGFGTMVACAKSLVKRLDGVIVDDSNTPLSDAALSEIAGQVLAFYEEMQTCQITAGSPRALRLFA
jgi:FtsZ-interacting cell division protein ZipA